MSRALFLIEKKIDLIATSLNRRDDNPNQDLAIEIIKSKRNDWVKELVDNLKHKDKNIQSDCIKVLYETGERGPADMIAPYCRNLGDLLKEYNELTPNLVQVKELRDTQEYTAEEILSKIIEEATGR